MQLFQTGKILLKKPPHQRQSVMAVQKVYTNGVSGVQLVLLIRHDDDIRLWACNAQQNEALRNLQKCHLNQIPNPHI